MFYTQKNTLLDEEIEIVNDVRFNGQLFNTCIIVTIKGQWEVSSLRMSNIYYLYKCS